MSEIKTEIQSYTTLYKKGKFEIRFYPKANLASVKMEGNYEDTKSSGFRLLAGYIFGGNKQNKKIAMTSPVRMSENKEVFLMSFVMPSEMGFNDLPVPKDKQIELHQTEAVYVATLRFGGYADNRRVTQKKAQLQEFLMKMNLHHFSHFELLVYNSPYRIVNRRNEILIPLDDFNPESFSAVNDPEKEKDF